MWYLELFGDVTDIAVIDVSNEESILSCLETALDTDYPEDFPYGCFDVEVNDRNDKLIDVTIIHEGHHGEMEKYNTSIIKL